MVGGGSSDIGMPLSECPSVHPAVVPVLRVHDPGGPAPAAAALALVEDLGLGGRAVPLPQQRWTPSAAAAAVGPE